jgi:hypothetical protein
MLVLARLYIICVIGRCVIEAICLSFRAATHFLLLIWVGVVLFSDKSE